jgi:hypothetical protein
MAMGMEMEMEMEIIMDMILITDTIIIGVMIPFITMAGIHLLCSALTSETDGGTTIIAGMDITITMVAMNTDRIITDTRILMVIIPTGTPQVPRREEIRVIIREYQLIIIAFQEGESLQEAIQGMKLTMADRKSDQSTRSTLDRPEDQSHRQLTEDRVEIFVTQEISRITEVMLLIPTVPIIRGTFMPA